jgi:cell division septation protein DedD
MRLAHPRLAVPIAMLTLALAGCGGATVTVEEVPGDPPQLTIPGDGAALAPAATASPTATPTATVDANTAAVTPTPDAGAAATPTPEGTTGGGTTAPDTGAPAPTPSPGSSDDEFEAFCAENPGAC